MTLRNIHLREKKKGTTTVAPVSSVENCLHLQALISLCALFSFQCKIQHGCSESKQSLPFPIFLGSRVFFFSTFFLSHPLSGISKLFILLDDYLLHCRNL